VQTVGLPVASVSNIHTTAASQLMPELAIAKNPNILDVKDSAQLELSAQ
jgi:hypothetical protein